MNFIIKFLLVSVHLSHSTDSISHIRGNVSPVLKHKSLVTRCCQLWNVVTVVKQQRGNSSYLSTSLTYSQRVILFFLNWALICLYAPLPSTGQLLPPLYWSCPNSMCLMAAEGRLSSVCYHRVVGWEIDSYFFSRKWPFFQGK